MLNNFKKSGLIREVSSLHPGRQADGSYPIDLFCWRGLDRGLVAWWIVRFRIEHAASKVKGSLESERAVLAERLKARDQQIQELHGSIEKAVGETDHLREENTELRARLSETFARLEEERRIAGEKLALLNEAQQKLSDAFKALSADALKSNNQSFLELAKVTWKSSGGGQGRSGDKAEGGRSAGEPSQGLSGQGRCQDSGD